ncbi:MAG TPA: alginate export family protein [Planctomycetota bacterium]|nr:alginate export family protein [Planctomycetota bacterium]
MQLSRVTLSPVAFAVLLLSVAGALRGGEGVYSTEKADLPSTPFSDAAARVKNMPIVGGWEASLGGSLQTRAQSVDNRRDFRYDQNDEDFSIQNRVRINFDLHYGDLAKIFVEAQDAHEFFRDRLPGNNPNEDSLDLYQAYLEIGLMKDVVDKPSLIFRLGRQEMQLGREYLIGDKDWFNRGQSFDLARAIWKPDGFEVELFGGAPVVFDDRNWNKTSDTHFYGSWLRAVGIPGGHLIEGGIFYKVNETDTFTGESGSKGAERIWLFNGRAEGTFHKNWDYALELTGDFGTRGDERVRAWRGDANLGYTIPINWRTVRLGVAYGLSSGDARPDDGRTERFDSLFPDPFIFHGRLFVAAGVNLEDYTAKIRATPWRGGLVEIEYHRLFLQQSRDFMFDAASFTGTRRDPTGRAGKDVGHAIDVQITHKFHENLLVTGGAFMHEPGHRFTHVGNRGSDFARNYFVMVRVGF